MGRGSQRERRLLRRAPGPHFAAALASAISVSDSGLGPPAPPPPWAGRHPSPAQSAGGVTQAGPGDLEGQHATLGSSHREGVSLQGLLQSPTATLDTNV